MSLTRDSAGVETMSRPGNDWVAWNDAMANEDVFRHAMKSAPGDESPDRAFAAAGAGIAVAYIHENANRDEYRARWERERMGLLARERNVIVRETFADKVQYDRKNGFVALLHSIRVRPVQLVIIPNLTHFAHLRSPDHAVRVLQRFGAEVAAVEPG